MTPEDGDDLTDVRMRCLAWAQAHVVNPKTGEVLGSDNEWKLLPVRHQKPPAALVRFIGRVVVSEQKVETAQDAGCDTDHCNQERNSSHGLSFGESVTSTERGNDQKRRAPVNCSVIRTGGLGPINARTSGLAQLMTPPTSVARAHLVSPKPGVVLFLLRPSKNSLVNDQVVGPLPRALPHSGAPDRRVPSIARRRDRRRCSARPRLSLPKAANDLTGAT